MLDAKSILKGLDADYAGHVDIKNALASRLAEWVSSPNKNGPLTIVARGDGGTGKIVLAKAIAKTVFGNQQNRYEEVIAYSPVRENEPESLSRLLEARTGIHSMTTGGFISSNMASGALLNVRTTADVFDGYANLIDELRSSPDMTKFILYIGFRPDSEESPALSSLVRKADFYMELANDLSRLKLVANDEIIKYNNHPLITRVCADQSVIDYFAEMFLKEYHLLYHFRAIQDAIQKAADELRKETPASRAVPPFRLVLKNEAVSYERI